MTPTTIESLTPGTAFALACNGRRGVLLALSPGAASVRYAGSRHVRIGDVEFDAPASRPVTIARSTQVVPEEVAS